GGFIDSPSAALTKKFRTFWKGRGYQVICGPSPPVRGERMSAVTRCTGAMSLFAVPITSVMESFSRTPVTLIKKLLGSSKPAADPSTYADMGREPWLAICE